VKAGTAAAILCEENSLWHPNIAILRAVLSAATDNIDRSQLLNHLCLCVYVW